MKRLIFGVGAVAVGAIVALVGLWVYATYYVADAPEQFALPDPTPSATVSAPNPSESEVRVPLDGTWTLASGQGGYRVNEVLNGVDNTVVGRTPDVSGSLVIQSSALESGQVVVTLANVKTDTAARDDFVKGHLELGKFPDATFTFGAGEDIGGIDSGDLDIRVPGTLTLHGETHDEIAKVQARRTGNTVTVVASIDVNYTDYGVGAPNLGFAVVEPLATIEVQLVFEPATE